MQVTGKVKNKNTNEAIAGAVVFVSDALGKVLGAGTFTDVNGRYFLSANNGDYITAQIIGMKPLTQKVNGSVLNYNLQDASSTLGTFEVVAPKPEQKPESIPTTNKNYVCLIAGIGLAVSAIIIVAIRKIAKR
jgi:hypothetical protein